MPFVRKPTTAKTLLLPEMWHHVIWYKEYFLEPAVPTILPS